MDILVITGRNHTKSNRGIDVIIDYLCGSKIIPLIYVYPISNSNHNNTLNILPNHVYAKKKYLNYYEKLLWWLPSKFTKWVFNYVYAKTNVIDFKMYDYIILESGYCVSLISKMDSNCKIIYRQSDSIELILSKNKYLIKCEREVIRRALLTLVPNDGILDFYRNIQFGNIHLWENGFHKDTSIKVSKLNKTRMEVSCVYMGLYPIDYDLLRFLSRKYLNIIFHIIGPHKKKNIGNNVIFHGYLNIQDYQQYLDCASFAILPIKSAKRLEYVSQTSKILQFLYNKKPVVSLDYGTLSRFASRTSNIYLCSTYEDFDSSISELVDSNFLYHEDIDLTDYVIKNRKESLGKILAKEVKIL